jgi:hypothetical protein
MVNKMGDFCSVKNCDRLATTRGWCTKHYKRYMRHGDPEKTLFDMSKLPHCTFENCTRSVEGKGLCSMHAKRMRKHGDPSVLLIEHNIGKKCQVAACGEMAQCKGYCLTHYHTVFDYGREYLIMNPRGIGTITKDGYKEIYVNGEKILEHVHLAQKALGKPLPPKAVVHHLNGNKLDNFSFFNLVICPDQAYHMLLHKRTQELGRTTTITLEDLGL